jgi:hypothetical protein
MATLICICCDELASSEPCIAATPSCRPRRCNVCLNKWLLTCEHQDQPKACMFCRKPDRRVPRRCVQSRQRRIQGPSHVGRDAFNYDRTSPSPMLLPASAPASSSSTIEVIDLTSDDTPITPPAVDFRLRASATPAPLCIACTARPVCVVLFPCSHTVTCLACTVALGRHPCCPKCAAKLESYGIVR